MPYELGKDDLEATLDELIVTRRPIACVIGRSRATHRGAFAPVRR